MNESDMFRQMVLQAWARHMKMLEEQGRLVDELGRMFKGANEARNAVMNPGIPTRPCAVCGEETNEIQFVGGVVHKRCFDRWLPDGYRQPDGRIARVVWEGE